MKDTSSLSYNRQIKEIEQARRNHKNKNIVHTYILMIFLISMFAYQFLALGDGIQAYITHTNDIFTGTFYTLVTALFFHTGIFHLLGNLLGLLLFGRIAEPHLGFRIYLVFLLGGVFANLVSNTIAYFLGQEYASLGASSGIAAIILFAVLLEPLRFTTLIGWLLIGLDIKGLANPNSTINHLAHLSGYLSLLVLYFFIEKTHKQKVIKGVIINGIMLLIVYLVLKINGIFF